ncbi:MAG: hypothetical protein U0746_17425 [Gemmataceae bacterium]
MFRSLTILFRRDGTRDRARGDIDFRGVRMFWPDGREVAVGLSAFCGHGHKLLGLEGELDECRERPVELLCVPVRERGVRMTRLPGRRVRRFMLRRDGVRGRLHFLNGVATDIEFVIGRDEPRVLDWLGLTSLPDGGEAWMDIAARPATVAAHAPYPTALGARLATHSVV